MTIEERSPLYWSGQIAAWGGLFALGLLFQILGGRELRPVVGSLGAIAVAGLATSHLVRLWISTHRWLDRAPVGIGFRAMAAGLAIGLAIALAGTFIGRAEPSGSHTFLWLTGLGTVVGLAWTSIYLGASSLHRLERAKRAASELAAASREAELAALKAQLDPHFMFNSLNAIRSLIEEDPPRARRAVTHLAGLMRYATSATRSSVVALADEVATVRSYLELETIRFDERLRSSVEVDADLGATPVPPLVIQTLVENGIKHGVSREANGGIIRVAAERVDGALRLEVRNPGRLEDPQASDGVGIDNLRRRLALLYGDPAELELSQAGNEVVATVRIPIGGAREVD